VVAGFRNKGLVEIYLTGRSRRIGAEYVRKCVRILQSLEVATQPEDMNVTGYRFHSLRGNPRGRKRWWKEWLPPVHPGEIIREDILAEPRNLPSSQMTIRLILFSI